MKNEPISRTQLAALIWAGTLAPAAELLPAVTLPVSGKGAWLAPAAAIPLVLLAGWLLGRLSDGGIQAALGPFAGRCVQVVYIVWAELLFGLRLRLCAQRLLGAGERDGTLFFFLLATAAMALWMALGRLEAFARAGQLFLTALLLTGGVVLLLSLSQTRLERVLPLWGDDLLPVLRGALPAAGALSWGLFGGFLARQARAAEKERVRHWTAWVVGGCFLLTVSQFILIGNLGPVLAGRLNSPFFTLAKSVGVEGAFQRIESIVAVVWTCADLSLAVLLLFALRALSEETAGRAFGKPAQMAGGFVGVVLALTLFSGGRAQMWNERIVPMTGLVLGLAVPAGICTLAVLRGKSRGKGISCGGNAQDTKDMVE